MPKYMDHHDQMPQMPPEAIQGLADSVRAGHVNEHGVRVINVIMGTDGSADCLSEAPSADAVIAAHAAMGVEAGTVREVMTLV